MNTRSDYLRLYYSSGRLDQATFPEADNIRCHVSKDRQSVIFFNCDTGAVSASLPVLNNIDSNSSVIWRITRQDFT
jgi:hypothetical protein